MKETKSLKQALQSVKEMQSENQHRKEVAGHHGGNLKTPNNHAVYVVSTFRIDEHRAFGLNDSEREMKNVIDEKAQNEQTREDDISRQDGCFPMIRGMLISNRPRTMVEPSEVDSDRDVDDEEAQQDDSSDPQQRVTVQPCGIGVHHLRALKDRQIAEHVHDQETDECKTAHRKGELLADRSIQQPDELIDEDLRGTTKTTSVAFLRSILEKRV